MILYAVYSFINNLPGSYRCCCDDGVPFSTSQFVASRLVRIVLGNHDLLMFLLRKRPLVLAMCGWLSLMPRHPALNLWSALVMGMYTSPPPGIYVCSVLALHGSTRRNTGYLQYPGHIFCNQCCHWFNYRHILVLLGKVFFWAFQWYKISVFLCIITALRLKKRPFLLWVYSTVHYIYPVRTVYLVDHH